MDARPLDWWLVPGIWVALFYFAFLQNLGQTSFDTKFDLTADPGDFLARSLHLWNQQSSFGELQNQAYGYLFPQGAFFWVGELVGLPDWMVQRFWSGLLLVLAFEGARRLWRAMAPEASPWSAILGGLAFATAPRLLGLAGVLSAEVLPTAVLPWVVLPVVLAQTGRLGIRTGALLSGSRGAVHGRGQRGREPRGAARSRSSWCSPPGVVRAAGGWPRGGWRRWPRPPRGGCCRCWCWASTARPSSTTSRPRSRSSGRSAGSTPSAARTTGSPTTSSAAGPGGRASYDLSTGALLIALTSVVAALGLAGLALRAMPWRRPLTLSLLVGVLCLTVARAGPLESPLHDFFQYLLDDPLSMLRNVHKVDPLVRLPLALGLAHAVSVLLARRTHLGRRRVARASAVVVVAALVVAAAQPLFLGRMRKEGWTELPDAWQEAAAYLAGPEARGATLVLPGSGFGQQWWGWTIDEPIQGLAGAPWVTRSQVPLTPGATIRLLDSIEDRIVDGQGSPELADDAGPGRHRPGAGAARHRLLHQRGAGARARRPRDLPEPGAGAGARLRPLRLRRPADDRRLPRRPPVERAEAFALTDVVTLAGGPDDVITALEAGDLRPEQPTVIWGEEGRPQEAPDIVGDGYRKRERAFGRLNDAVSQVMAADEPFRTRRAANDYPGCRARRSSSPATTTSRRSPPRRPAATPTPSATPGPSSVPTRRSTGRRPPTGSPRRSRSRSGSGSRRGSPSPTRLGYVDVRPATDGIAGVPVREIEVTAGDQVAPGRRSTPRRPTSGCPSTAAASTGCG